MDLITYLEENSNIDSQFIEDIFEKIDYNEYYLDIDILMKWNKVEDKEEYKKNFMENNKDKYIIENEKVLLDLPIIKELMNEENRKKIYKLENLVNKYNKYRIKKLKKQIRSLKRSVKNNNKVVLNTINPNEPDIILDVPKCESNIDYKLCHFKTRTKCSYLLNQIIFYVLLGLTICRIIYIYYSLFLCSSNSNSKCSVVLSIFNRVTIFVLIVIIIVKIFLLFSSSLFMSFINKSL